MDEELKLLYETLKDVNNALDYCGDGWEREATRDTRIKASEVLDEFEKKYKVGEYSPEHISKKYIIQKYYRCPFCDKEHLKDSSWIVDVIYGRSGRPSKFHYEIVGFIDHIKAKHSIKESDKPKVFDTFENWIMSIVEEKEKERVDRLEAFVDCDEE